ncbi:MAG: NifU family protein [Owenweeksia sp.]|nr:NifU family protein [Owenweeksia sp.]
MKEMEEQKKAPVSVYAEMTPNPAVLKFVANQRLVQADHIEFKNIEEAQPSPLAVKLFHYPFVKEVFISGNYVAITKYDIVEWEDVTMEVREMLRDYLANGQPVMEDLPEENSSGATTSAPHATQAIHPDEKNPEEWEEIEKKIASLLDEYVKPAVAQDGGNIKFLKYDEGKVKVLLQGACSGCPSSTMTLRQGIQNLLEQMLPGQVQAVEAVNG